MSTIRGKFLLVIILISCAIYIVYLNDSIGL